MAPSSAGHAGGLRVERPDLLHQQAQRDLIGRDRQGAMNEPPLTGTTTQRSQTLGGSQAAPVGLSRILHGQYQGSLCEAAIGHGAGLVLASR